MKKYAVIVAGGSGKRMANAIPKQFLLLNKKPVLQHTLEAFAQCEQSIDLIVVLPEDQTNTWKALCQQNPTPVPHQVVVGGQERYHSVKNGLEHTSKNSLIAIHDGVRPLVTSQLIHNGYIQAEKKGSAIPVTEITCSIRKLNKQQSSTVNREEFREVQTPQIFRSEILIPAYEQPYIPQFTDDASVVEASGNTIHLIPGERKNIKITTPEDLIIASALLNASC